MSLKFVHKVRINKIPAFGSDNGFMPTKRQAIIWINDGNFTDAYMRHSAWVSQELSSVCIIGCL